MWAERCERVARERSLQWLVEPTMQRWFTAAADPQLVARVGQTFSETSVDGYLGHAAAIAAHHVSPEQLRSIAVPTLIVSGAGDSGTPVGAHEALAAGIPGSRLAVLAGLAHALPAQAPELFAQLAADFLQ